MTNRPPLPATVTEYLIMEVFCDDYLPTVPFKSSNKNCTSLFKAACPLLTAKFEEFQLDRKVYDIDWEVIHKLFKLRFTIEAGSRRKGANDKGVVADKKRLALLRPTVRSSWGVPLPADRSGDRILLKGILERVKKAEENHSLSTSVNNWLGRFELSSIPEIVDDPTPPTASLPIITTSLSATNAEIQSMPTIAATYHPTDNMFNPPVNGTHAPQSQPLADYHISLWEEDESLFGFDPTYGLYGDFGFSTDMSSYIPQDFGSPPSGRKRKASEDILQVVQATADSDSPPANKKPKLSTNSNVVKDPPQPMLGPSQILAGKTHQSPTFSIPAIGMPGHQPTRSTISRDGFAVSSTIPNFLDLQADPGKAEGRIPRETLSVPYTSTAYGTSSSGKIPSTHPTTLLAPDAFPNTDEEKQGFLECAILVASAMFENEWCRSDPPWMKMFAMSYSEARWKDWVKTSAEELYGG